MSVEKYVLTQPFSNKSNGRIEIVSKTLCFTQKGSGVYGKRAEAHATAEKYVHQDAGCHGFGGLSCGEHDDPPQYINFSETCGSGLVASAILFGYLALYNMRKTVEENVFFTNRAAA